LQAGCRDVGRYYKIRANYMLVTAQKPWQELVGEIENVSITPHRLQKLILKENSILMQL
jgi:hypothetical protein